VAGKMKQQRLMLRVDVVDDGEGKISVLLRTHDSHIGNCASCLSLYSLRVSAAFLGAVEAIEQGESGDDEPAEGERHPLH
jgi:hypothetical protein